MDAVYESSAYAAKKRKNYHSRLAVEQSKPPAYKCRMAQMVRRERIRLPKIWTNYKIQFGVLCAKSVSARFTFIRSFAIFTILSSSSVARSKTLSEQFNLYVNDNEIRVKNERDNHSEQLNRKEWLKRLEKQLRSREFTFCSFSASTLNYNNNMKLTE